ncbi:hypothetical protein [Methylobacterium sp. JK268]
MSEHESVPVWARRRLQRLQLRNPSGKIARWISLAGPARAPDLPGPRAHAEAQEGDGTLGQSGNVIPFAARTTASMAGHAAA